MTTLYGHSFVYSTATGHSANGSPTTIYTHTINSSHNRPCTSTASYSHSAPHLVNSLTRYFDIRSTALDNDAVTNADNSQRMGINGTSAFSPFTREVTVYVFEYVTVVENTTLIKTTDVTEYRKKATPN